MLRSFSTTMLFGRDLRSGVFVVLLLGCLCVACKAITARAEQQGVVGLNAIDQSESQPQAYIIVLEGEPAARSFLKAQDGEAGRPNAGTRTSVGTTAARNRLAQILAQQDAFATQLKALGLTE